MNQALGLLNFLLLTAGLFAGLTSVAVALGYPLLRPRLAKLPPRKRARMLYLLCAAPLGLGLLHTALCFLPGALGTVWSSLDHCLYHDHGDHARLCLVHLPGTTGTIAGWLVGSMALVFFMVPFSRQLWRNWRSYRRLRQLAWSARRDETRGVLLIDSELPFAAATLRESDILMSTSMLERLSPAHLDAVLEHERAHLRRRDPLWRVIAALVAAAHLPGTRRLLLDDLEISSERACDEEAGQRLGSRVQVAQALLAVERLLHDRGHEQTAAYIGFAGPHIVCRVEALLAPPVHLGAKTREWQWLTAGFALSVAMTEPLHHATETLITLIGA